MRSVEKEGRTVEEAIAKALEDLGVGEEQAQIEILSETNRKVFGFLGSRTARVRATVKEEDALLAGAKRTLGALLEKMSIQAEISGERMQDCLLLEVESQAGGLLIGRKGKTLDALQFLLNRILNPNGVKGTRVLLDTEGYRARRREELASFALRAADKARAGGEEVVLVPLGPYERRIVHLTLQKDLGVRTFSEGDGYLKKVHVVPLEETAPRPPGGEDTPPSS